MAVSIASHILRIDAKYAVLLLALLTPAVGSSTAKSATFSWLNVDGGNFNQAGNWSEPGVPGAGDFVKFEVASGVPFTVTFPGNGAFDPVVNYQTSYMWVRDNGVTFSGSTQAFKGPSAYSVLSGSQTEGGRGIIIGVFAGENASLNLSHSGNACCGGLTSLSGAAATLGDAANSAGTLNVGVGEFNVTGSDFTQTQLIVGNYGSGAVNIFNGADVNVPGTGSRTSLGQYAGSNGAVNIIGAGSTWTSAGELWVGEFGAGTLTVQNGGSLITGGSGGNTVVGTFQGSAGTISVTDAGSSWTSNSGIRIGNTGSGTLTIGNGGQLIHNDAFAPIEIGSGASGTVTVTDPGSSLTSSAILYVGSTSTGALAIQNGGIVTSGRALIRSLDNASSEVVVSGAGSAWNVTNVLEIGLPQLGFTTGPTKLTINPGATVTVGQDIDLDTNGLVKLTGGTLTANSIRSNDLLDLQYEGTFEWTAGTLSVDYVFGPVNNQGGTLAPRANVDGMTIHGNYTQHAPGALQLDIGGDAPGTEYDYVFVTGAASLDGRLDVKLDDLQFVPSSSAAFVVLTANSLTGAFVNVANGQRLTTTDGRGSFLVHYGAGSIFPPTAVVLSDFSASLPLPGDYNHDGAVDAADYTVWRDSPSNLGGDPGGYNIWRANFGKTSGNSAMVSADSNISVPEPGSLGLLTLAVPAILGRRKYPQI